MALRRTSISSHEKASPAAVGTSLGGSTAASAALATGGVSAKDKTDVRKMDPVLGAFWQWCAKEGFRVKPLIVADRPSDREADQRQQAEFGVHRFVQVPPVRSVFTAEALKAGAIVAVIPFRSCITAHSTRFALPRHMLGPIRTNKLLKRAAGLPPYEAQHLWLAALMASLRIANPKSHPWSPYLNLMPTSFHVQDQIARQFVAQLPSPVQEAYAETVTTCSMHMRSIARLTDAVIKKRKLSSAVPSAKALEWGYRTVLSRTVVIPEGCAPSVPENLDEFLTKNPDYPVVPAMIPVLDMFNSPADPRDPPNCEVYTGVELGDVTNNDRRRGVADIPENASVEDRRVIIATNRPVDAGEELTIGYSQEDQAATLYRHGYLIPEPKDEGEDEEKELEALFGQHRVGVDPLPEDFEQRRR